MAARLDVSEGEESCLRQHLAQMHHFHKAVEREFRGRQVGVGAAQEIRRDAERDVQRAGRQQCVPVYS
eukprot:9411481-Prorocentrum_lima.AAC.1